MVWHILPLFAVFILYCSIWCDYHLILKNQSNIEYTLIKNPSSTPRIIKVQIHVTDESTDRARMEFQYENKGNNKITELQTILQRESQNS
jgi:hypothetical protein